MSTKYSIKEIPLPGAFEGYKLTIIALYKDDQDIAHFHGEDKKTNAQKICDLLNETSHSQGKYK